MDQKKLAVWIFVLGVGGFISAGLGFYWWDRGALPGFKPTIVDVSIEDINLDYRGVRINAMARHDVKITQQVSGEKWFVYPLVPKDNINTKFIKVMVMTQVPPDSMASIEERTVIGLAKPPGRLIPKEIYESWRGEGYTFEDRVVLIEEFPEETQ
jgi:hypothetical protein